jgi:hypothetical protein
MPGLKRREAAQTEYLLDALRHIEAVARAVIDTVGPGGPPPPPFASGCLAPPELLPRPFGRWCAGMTDLGHGPAGKAVAGRRAPKARLSRKQVKR